MELEQVTGDLKPPHPATPLPMRIDAVPEGHGGPPLFVPAQPPAPARVPRHPRPLLPSPMSFAESVSPFMAHNRGHFEPARRVIQFIIERKPPAMVPSRLAGSPSARLRAGH